jgi:hypothetical protein
MNKSLEPFIRRYIYIFLLNEFFYPLRQRGGSSCASEAHSGGREGLGEDGQEPTLPKRTHLILR